MSRIPINWFESNESLCSCWNHRCLHFNCFVSKPTKYSTVCTTNLESLYPFLPDKVRNSNINSSWSSGWTSVAPTCYTCKHRHIVFQHDKGCSRSTGTFWFFKFWFFSFWPCLSFLFFLIFFRNCTKTFSFVVIMKMIISTIWVLLYTVRVFQYRVTFFRVNYDSLMTHLIWLIKPGFP